MNTKEAAAFAEKIQSRLYGDEKDILMDIMNLQDYSPEDFMVKNIHLFEMTEDLTDENGEDVGKTYYRVEFDYGEIEREVVLRWEEHPEYKGFVDIVPFEWDFDGTWDGEPLYPVELLCKLYGMDEAKDFFDECDEKLYRRLESNEDERIARYKRNLRCTGDIVTDNIIRSFANADDGLGLLDESFIKDLVSKREEFLIEEFKGKDLEGQMAVLKEIGHFAEEIEAVYESLFAKVKNDWIMIPLESRSERRLVAKDSKYLIEAEFSVKPLTYKEYCGCNAVLVVSKSKLLSELFPEDSEWRDDIHLEASLREIEKNLPYYCDFLNGSDWKIQFIEDGEVVKEIPSVTCSPERLVEVLGTQIPEKYLDIIKNQEYRVKN